MKNQTRIWIVLSIILCLADIGYSQETSLTFPTNDNTSSFNVMKNDGTSVFKVDGNGMMTGNGNGLSNVKPVVVYSNGDDGAPYDDLYGYAFVFKEGYMTGLNTYEAQSMKELTINCPGPGTIVAQATGYIYYHSTEEDLARIWFHPHPTVFPSDWETPDYRNLRIVSDCKCADASDQYNTWSISRVYTVGSAQNFTVRICADKPFTESFFLLSDISMQLMFFPQ